MRILLDTHLLCDSLLAIGQAGPSGLTLNGESIEDEAAFFRAAAKVYFERGNESVQLQFRVQRTFDTKRLAQKFFFTHRNLIPRQGHVQIEMGEGVDLEDLYLHDALVQPQMVGIEGVCVFVQYTLKGGQFTTDVPEPLPSADPEEEAVSYRRGAVAIASAAGQVDVVFSTPLASPPTTVTPHVSHVTGDDAIDCELLQDTITALGFSVKLSAPAPNANYKLHYSAFL